jgi:hypothetical protein
MDLQKELAIFTSTLQHMRIPVSQKKKKKKRLAFAFFAIQMTPNDTAFYSHVH